jgi:RNA polymerase sigma-70 factor (ECF subfamily)
MNHENFEYENADDAELVRRAATDKQAFGELYQRYVTRIYNYIYFRTSNQHDAEDLTSRVFFRAMEHIKNYDERGVPFSAWLYRIAHNLVANWHRDNSRRKIIPLDEYLLSKMPSDNPELMAESAEEQEHLIESIHELPEDRQQLLFLKFVERLSNAEIGELMNRTEGAVKSLYHRTLVTLQEDLARRGIAPINILRKRQKNRLNEG